MKAAKNFSFGDGDKNHVFKVGDEIPSKIAKELDDSFILEKVAKSNPDSLSRAQLLELAGVQGGEGEEEFDESEFREGLTEFRTKADLIEWANGAFGVELDESDTRDQLEDQIVAMQMGDDEEYEDEEEDEEDEDDEDE